MNILVKVGVKLIYGKIKGKVVFYYDIKLENFWIGEIVVKR